MTQINDAVLATLEQVGYNVRSWRYEFTDEDDQRIEMMDAEVSSNRLRDVPAIIEGISPFGGYDVNASLMQTTEIRRRRWTLRFVVWLT